MINIPVKLWEKKSYKRFENPTNIIYPCLLYLPISNVIGQDKKENVVWDCNTKKWVTKISYEYYKIVFNVYGRNFSSVVRNKYKIGDMKFIYLKDGFHNNGELSLASIGVILDYELKKYKSLQVRILSIKNCNLPAIDCYCSANIQILSRYSSETFDIEVNFLGYMFVNDIPQNTIGMEINDMPSFKSHYVRSNYPQGYYLNTKSILCFYLDHFRRPIQSSNKIIESNQTNNIVNWLLFNIDKLLLPLVTIISLILFIIYYLS